MPAQLIDGRALAKRVREEVARDVAALASKGVVPGLAVLLIGADPASAIYVRNKERAAARCGIAGRTIRLDADVSAAQIAEEIAELNDDPTVHGILVQLPLPARISVAETQALLDSVDPDKDVDGFHPTNLGRLMAGQEGFVACTPSGCMRMLAEIGVDLTGKHAVVLGRSTIVGKPMAMLLMQANATVTICHSRTTDLPAQVRSADVVIAAVGRPEMVRGDWLKPGAVVNDVGINRREDGTLCGDVAFSEAMQVAAAVSPVPGGVGPMTIAYLLKNVCVAARRANGL